MFFVLSKKKSKNQEASYNFRLGFALSKRPHFNSVYLVRVPFLTGIAVQHNNTFMLCSFTKCFFISFCFHYLYSTLFQKQYLLQYDKDQMVHSSLQHRSYIQPCSANHHNFHFQWLLLKDPQQHIHLNQGDSNFHTLHKSIIEAQLYYNFIFLYFLQQIQNEGSMLTCQASSLGSNP